MRGKTTKPNQENSRRNLLRFGGLAFGGAALGGIGLAAADKPTRFKKDLTGKTFDYIPCLGEGVEIIQGTIIITVDVTKSGKCWHLNFHRHYSEKLVVEGLDTGRTWTGQGPKNNNFNVCPPYPGEQTVTNSTTITSKNAEEDKVVQFRFIAHVTVNANGDVTIAFEDSNFVCHA